MEGFARACIKEALERRPAVGEVEQAASRIARQIDSGDIAAGITATLADGRRYMLLTYEQYEGDLLRRQERGKAQALANPPVPADVAGLVEWLNRLTVQYHWAENAGKAATRLATLTRENAELVAEVGRLTGDRNYWKRAAEFADGKWQAAEAEAARLRGALEPFAEQYTIDEIMAGKSPDGWAQATVGRRIEMMGERKKANTNNILRARAALAPKASDADLGKIGPGHVCKHGVRWPHACQPCDDAAWEARNEIAS
jgi:hypothetical protein